jgi:periplasmic protein TonB
MSLRAITWMVSAGLHAAIASLFLVTAGGASLDQGSGDDQLVAEAGISIEGLSKTGDAEISTSALEAEPVEMSEARPAIEEVKAVKEVEDTKVIQSMAGPEQEQIDEEIKQEQPRPQQIATLEQVPQVAVEEKQAAGAAQTGGDATALNAYRGKLWTHLGKKKFAPSTRAAGTVIVRFKLDAAGQLLSSVVEMSSGNKLLDDAAIRMIERAAPFPPIPGELAQTAYEERVPIKFTVR